MLSMHAGGGEGDGGAEGQGHEPLNKAAECGLAVVVSVRWFRLEASMDIPNTAKGWLLHSRKKERIAAINVGCWAGLLRILDVYCALAPYWFVGVFGRGTETLMMLT